MSRHIWATCSSRGSHSDLWPLARLSQGTLKATSDAQAPPENQLDHCSSQGYFLEFAQTTWSQGWEVSLPHFSVSSVHWNWQLRSQDHDLYLDRGTRACAGSDWQVFQWPEMKHSSFHQENAFFSSPHVSPLVPPAITQLKIFIELFFFLNTLIHWMQPKKGIENYPSQWALLEVCSQWKLPIPNQWPTPGPDPTWKDNKKNH